MSEDTPLRRWGDQPGVYEIRIGALELQHHDHEMRIRKTEALTISMDTKLDNISVELREARTSSARNVATTVIGVILVICTVIGGHLIWH